MIGQVVGSYRIVAELGKGGMGVVYRAEHVQLGRPAALKMLLPSLSSEPAIVQRFFNEARAASAIDHPGIVEIYDFGTHTDGSAYIVMALLKGESLEQRLARGPVSPIDGANIVAQVAGALSAAHEQQIVHRDLKPDNIFLVPNDMMPGGVQVKLLDFGIAKLADDKASGVKTQTGALIGTPAYMSPEQCMGQSDIDHRTDLYSIGCILFHLMCGRPPFLSEHGTGMMIAAHIRDPAPAPRSLNPNIPEPMEAIILRLLEKDPAARFQTASELRAALVGAGASAPSTWRGRAAPQSMQFAATMAPPSTGPEAYAATSAAGTGEQPGGTTRGGAAAELVSAAATAPDSRKSRGWLLGLGVLLLAGAGVAAFLVVKSGQSDDAGETTATAAAAPGGEIESPAPPAEPQPAVDVPALPPIQPPADPACPEGQVRGPDTRGNCCWPGQAWSISKSTCVGIPSCPAGTVAKGESCERAAKPETASRVPDPKASRKPDPSPRKPDPAPSGRAPEFSLAKRTFEPGESFAVSFASPVSSKGRNRAWVTIVEASKSDASYGAWTYVKDGATSAALKAPTKAGAYQVRLHTDYPAKRNNVVQRVAVTVGEAAAAPEKETAPAPASGETPRRKQRFSLASSTASAGGEVAISFAAPMVAAPGERFWITIVEADKPDQRYGKWKYLPKGARSISLPVPRKTGAYEVRLHANYPKKSTNVVYRRPVTVE